MELVDRIQDIVTSLEQAIIYEDMDIVKSSRDELIFVLEDMQSDFSDIYVGEGDTDEF